MFNGTAGAGDQSKLTPESLWSNRDITVDRLYWTFDYRSVALPAGVNSFTQLRRASGTESIAAIFTLGIRNSTDHNCALIHDQHDFNRLRQA